MAPWKTLVLVAATVGMTAATTVRAEETLKLIAEFPRGTIWTDSVLDNFVAGVNAAGKGVVQVRFMGGPEVTPGAQQMNALRRGVFDVLFTPATQHRAALPESDAMFASRISPSQARANGGFEMLSKAWRTKTDTHFVAWTHSTIHYNIYLRNPPKMKPDGGVDLSGLRIRTTATFNEILAALGASVVSIPTTETFSALERGVVDGIAFPEIGLRDFGFQKYVTYRIRPSFLNGPGAILVNGAKWDSLSPRAREILADEGRKFEAFSAKYIEDLVKTEVVALREAGIKDVEITGPAAASYTKAIEDSIWARMRAVLPGDTEALKAKFAP